MDSTPLGLRRSLLGSHPKRWALGATRRPVACLGARAFYKPWWWWFSHKVVSDSCNPMDCSPPGSSVHGILQARILEWVAMPSCRVSSRPRDQTCIPYVSCKPLARLRNSNYIRFILFKAILKCSNQEIVVFHKSTNMSILSSLLNNSIFGLLF